MVGPDEVATLSALGHVTLNLGDVEAAVVHCARVVELSPNAASLEALAQAQDAAGRSDAAAATRLRLQDCHPDRGGSQ